MANDNAQASTEVGIIAKSPYWNAWLRTKIFKTSFWLANQKPGWKTCTGPVALAVYRLPGMPIISVSHHHPIRPEMDRNITDSGLTPVSEQYHSFEACLRGCSSSQSFLYPRPTKLGGGGYTGFTLSVCPSVCRRHVFRSISQVSFGISISNFICMLMVAIGRSLLIFSDVTFKMAAWRPYWIFWFPDSNFTLALNINFKLQWHNTYVYG